MEKELQKILEALHLFNEIDRDEAQRQILLLFSVSGRSEQLSDLQEQIKRGELDPYSPHAKWIKP